MSFTYDYAPRPGLADIQGCSVFCVCVMLVAALTKSSGRAGSVGLILGFIMAGVAGCIGVLARVPLVRTEGLMGILANLTPHGHALDAYYSLMVEKATLVEILPQMGILLAMSVVFFLVAQWRFKFE
jgi:ABC-2 type transport system permease protein